jgi:hypothetical protein
MTPSGSCFRVAIKATVCLLRLGPCAVRFCVSSVAALIAIAFIPIVLLLLLLIWIVLSVASLLARLGAIALMLKKAISFAGYRLTSW